MRLTIDTMTYGPDGLARTDEGKAVFCLLYTSDAADE